METIINPEYQALIDKIDLAISMKDYYTTFKSYLEEVKEALRHLGSRPKLSDNVGQFMDITTNMVKTYAAKNHDYGNSFEQSLDKFGLIASIVRMGDKINRIESLSKKEANVKDESIKDTLLDLATYSVMTLMWLNNKN